MKKIIFFIGVIFTINLHGQIKVTNVGNVGIGMQPSNRLSINISGSNQVNFASWTASYIDQSGECGATCFYPLSSWYI